MKCRIHPCNLEFHEGYITKTLSQKNFSSFSFETKDVFLKCLPHMTAMFPLLAIIPLLIPINFTSTSSDEEILEDMDDDNMAIFHWMMIACNSHNFFTSHEIEEGMGQSMDARIGVQNILTTMWITPHLFKSFTNFTLAKFDELATLVVPTILAHAQSTSEIIISSWRFDFFLIKKSFSFNL